MTTTMKMPIGTILATVAMVFSAAASLDAAQHQDVHAPHHDGWPPRWPRVVPSPKTGKNCPSVALIRIRQATSARQQAIQ